MKTKTILLTLALALSLTACQNKFSKSDVSDETIAKALDGKVDLSKEEKEKDKDKNSDKKANKEEKEEITADTLREFMIDIGEFAPSLARNLDDDTILKLYEQAKVTSEDTGYWDVKDFFFQEIAKAYPDKSLKFPLDSVESKYSWKASEKGIIGDKFQYERSQMVDSGYSYDDIWSYTDKEVEDAFHTAYEENPRAFYEDYVKMAAKILTGNNSEEETSEDGEIKAKAKESDYENLLKFGASEKDYDVLRETIEKHYGFDKEVVKHIKDRDIDLAYTRAQKRLEETGFGDIGLIFDELGKLFPGASTMYPGE